MDIRVLGTLEIVDAGAVIPVQGRKQRAVLAVLVAAGGARMSTDQLIDAVYGEVAPERARRSIHTFMSSLRGILGEHIRSDRRGYVLDIPDDSVDSRRFERAYALGRQLVDDDPETAAEILREGLSEWRGHAYADIDALGVVDPEILRLEELRIVAVEARIDADLARGLNRELVSELSALVAEHPLREGFRAQHMLALYRSGRQAEALRSFSSARTMFVDQLGLEPSEQLANLELQILDHDPDLTIDLRQSIEEMAVLAVDLVASARTLAERDKEVRRIHALFERVATRAGGWLLDPRGTTMYGVFPSVERALSAAEHLIAGDGRMAVDHGEVDVAGDRVSGPPITRAARLAAVAHPGQVLLSADAHTALSAGSDDGRIVKNLGRQTLGGVPERAPVFQLIPASGPSEFGPLELDRRPTGEQGSVAESVSGYELRQLLWSDDLGSLHLGYQPALGRSVWVRTFPSAVVGKATFIRRFEAEMHRIAATNHPVLLPVLDFWREPDSATVVYSPVDGGVTFDPDDPAQGGLDTVLTLADAIDFAHERGVVHGRLHPGSIFIDAGNHPNLAFLGLAPILSGLTPLDAHAGTAPETIGSEPTPRADVYALAVLAAEALSGERWDPDTGPPLLEGPIGDVIRACLAPTGNHFSAGEFSAAIRQAAGRPAAIRRSIRNPYKGLAPFGEADIGDFFGRNELVDRLIREVGQHRLTAVVGPSGVGKSSAVRAGVLPQLRANRSSSLGSVVVTSMTPGVDPIESLADALGQVATRVPGPLVRALDADSIGLGEVVAAVLPPDSELLLVIDQFEELFTLATAADLRTFLAILGRELAAPTGPIRVLLTLRADFLDQPLAHPDFGKLIADRCVVMHGPSREELSEIILSPAADVGVEIEPGLVTALCDDASTQPGALPLVEHALAELFDRRTSDVITLDAYVAFGGLAGAVGRSAEEVYQGLDESDRAIAQTLLVSLVAVTEDSADTRRRLRLPQMVRRGLDKPSIDRMLETFVHRRLIVLDRDPKTHQPTAEVAHEALISEWNRLQTWIDEAREELLVARRLELAAADWIASGHDSSFLLAGGRLDRAETSAGHTAYEIGESERELLRESRRASDVQTARRGRNRRRSIVALSSALVVTVALAFAANSARGTAERRAIENRVRELIASAQGTIGTDHDLAILLALEAFELASTLGGDIDGEVMLTLHEATQASRIIARLPVGESVVLFDPAGDRLIVDVGGGSSELIIYDPRTFEEVGRLDVIHAPNGATLSHDGTLLAVSSGDVLRCRTGVDVRIFELETGAVVDELEEDSCFAFPQFGPDDRYVTAVGERSVPVWDRTEPEGQPVLLQDATGFAGGPSAFGADGTTIIRANGDAVEPKSITTYELATGHAIETRPLPVGAIRAVTSVPNTDKLLVATPTSGQFWAPGDVVAERKVPLTGLDHGTFSASGSLVALSGANSTVVVASADGATHLELRGHDGGVRGVAFSPDETMLAALVSSGEVVIWDLTPGGPPALTNIETVGLDWLIPLMSSDGRYVATIERSGDTSVARRYATTTGALIAQSSPSSVEVAVSRSGEWAGGVDSDGVAWIEWLGTNEVIFRRYCLAPAAINDEGTHAVFFSACGGKTTSLIDLRNGATISSWTRDGHPEFGPPGSPANGLFVDNNDSGPVFRSVSTGDIVAAPYIGVTWRPRFSADGRYLSLGSGLEGGYVLNVEAIVAGALKDEAVVINPLVEGGPTRTAMASGSFGVTTHNEDSIRVWSLATGDQWMNIPTQATTFGFVAMSPDGTVLYYPDHDGVLVRALLDPEELAKLARARATRDFTVEECQQFNIIDDCSIYEPEPARG